MFKLSRDAISQLPVVIGFQGFLGWAQMRWERVQDIGSVLRPCRFSVIMTLLGMVVLVLMPQGQDTLREFAEARDRRTLFVARQGLFLGAALLWAYFSWHFARQMLSFQFASSPITPGFGSPEEEAARWERIRRMCLVVPRLLGMACLVAVALGFLEAARAYRKPTDHQTLNWLMGLGISYGVLAFAFLKAVSVRRHLQFALYQQAVRFASTRSHLWQQGVELLAVKPADQEQFFVQRELKELSPASRAGIVFGMSVAVLLFVAFSLAPVFFGQRLGTATIILLAAGGWIPFGSVLVYLGSRSRIPIMTLLLAAAILFSFWNDNHQVRVVKTAASAEAVAQRMTIEERFDSWLGAIEKADPDRQRHPLILVAAEGGGIRAAFWTATVLSEIQDRYPDFSRHVFAISGVSGGSLGAAVFGGLVAESAGGDIERCRPLPESDAPGRHPMRDCAQAILARDFLGPVAGALLYPDLFQRFMPIRLPFADRARALEGAWEDSWATALPDSTRFRDPFLDLWKGDNLVRVPALLLNGTWVETGKRAIVSNLRVAPKAWPDAVDLLEVTKRDMALSSAVHLSARFTYVSPAGTIEDAAGRPWGHVVDGGYFENSATAGAYDLLLALRSIISENNPNKWAKVLPLIVVISNDPSSTSPKASSSLIAPKPQMALSEILSPVRAIFNTRQARGAYSLAALETTTGESTRWSIFHFQLCSRGIPLHLGWQVSALVRKEMTDQLGSGCDGVNNGDELKALGRLLTDEGRDAVPDATVQGRTELPSSLSGSGQP